MGKKKEPLVLEPPFYEQIEMDLAGDFDSDRNMFSQEMFLSRGSAMEGLSGRKRIDTTYENTQCDEYLSGAPIANRF